MRYWLAAIVVIALATGAVWLCTPSKPVAANQTLAVSPADPSRPSSLKSPKSADLEGHVDTGAIPADSAVMTEAAPAPPKPAPLASLAEPPTGPELAPGLGPMTVMENVRNTFRNYSARFGGNPVGTNQEITRTLNGANPASVPFLQPEDGLVLNDRGELVDNWGTPFFFHQLSRIEIEIRSAGPDRKMWTSDDLLMK